MRPAHGSRPRYPRRVPELGGANGVTRGVQGPLRRVETPWEPAIARTPRALSPPIGDLTRPPRTRRYPWEIRPVGNPIEIARYRPISPGLPAPRAHKLPPIQERLRKPRCQMRH